MERNTWPGWESVRKIGEGSFGKVYEIQREEFGKIYKAALKVITIPQNIDDDVTVVEGMDHRSMATYYRGMVKNITEEVALMSELKGHSNIVSYEDHMVMERENGLGWDILIRMELLTPLNKWAKEHPMREEDVVKLGCDICQALEICQKKSIIHRDIKPGNIFINENGDYKLGDFGIARTINRDISNYSVKGSYNYMAPEVYLGKAYGNSADLYSLGIVLYQYLNNNRIPFLPMGEVQYGDSKEALEKRMQGTPIPAPIHASEAMKVCILKAIAYEPSRRYQTAELFHSALKETEKNDAVKVSSKKVLKRIVVGVLMFFLLLCVAGMSPHLKGVFEDKEQAPDNLQSESAENVKVNQENIETGKKINGGESISAENGESISIKPEYMSEDYAMEMYNLGDLDTNGETEYLLIANRKEPNGIDDGNLVLYFNGEIIFELKEELRLYIGAVEYIDLDGDDKKEIFFTYLPEVNSMPLVQYKVLKKETEGWRVLETAYVNEYGYDSFPVSVEYGETLNTIFVGCEGYPVKYIYNVTNFYERQIEEASNQYSEEYISYFKNILNGINWEGERYYPGDPFGEIAAWGPWDIYSSQYSGRNCLVATLGLADEYETRLIYGEVDIYFDYDETGTISVLDMRFREVDDGASCIV